MGEFDNWDELGPPELRPVPEGHPRARNTAVVAAVVVAGVFLVSLGVVMVVRGGGGAPAKEPASPTETTVTESFTVTASPTASSTIVTSTPGDTSTAPEQPQFARETKVAYRQGGALWVAEESGAGPQKVATSTAGAFSLSPDGETLAFVDASSKTLALVDVATARVTTIGAADVRAAIWSPSSRWLAFTNKGEVRRVQADGSKLRYLGKGTRIAIAPDDVTYAYSTSGAIVVVDKDERPTKIAVKGGVDDLALGTETVFYSVSSASRSSIALRSVGLDGRGDKQLAGPPSDQKAGMYDDLRLSPDGVWLAYSATGDDLHSRLRCMRTDGTADTALSLRHDDYLVRWSADGSKLLFIDGNVLQGEATQLMSVRPDGTMRVTILKGAGI